MKKTLSTLVITILALAATGCNLLVKAPFSGPKLIPTETFIVDEAASTGSAITTAVLTLAPSNGSLNLSGDAERMGSGTIRYNVANWKPTLAVEGAALRIEQAMPDGIVASTPHDSLNLWDLQLGSSLADIRISCPAGNYTLSFGDTLPDGASISVNAGVGNLRLVFPAGASVNVEVHHGPASITTEGEWAIDGSSYSAGNGGQTWMVRVDIGVGTLALVVE